MTKFDPQIHDDNPPLDADSMSGMKPSRRGRPKLADPKVEVKIRLVAEPSPTFAAPAGANKGGGTLR